MNDISLDTYCDSINSDTYYIKDFRNWVKKGIHGKDLLPRSRWDEIWDDFAGTFDDEEENITEFEVDVNLERPLRVRKINDKWKCSDGSVYMGYLKPKDVVTWLRRDYGQAWLIESVNKNLKEVSINFPGSKTFDIYEGFEADVEFYLEKYNQDVMDGVIGPEVDAVEYIAGRIDEKYPTDNPMQFDSLIREVRALLPKIDKNWYSNMWGPVKESVGQPFVFIKIFDDWDDDEAVRVVARYGGQIDSDVWTISKENIQDIKDELDDWENRIAFYSSYNYGKFSRKLKEDKKQLKESNLKDSYDNILKDIREYVFMCNDSEDRFSGRRSFELSKKIFIENLSKTYMIHTKHIEEWFSEVESDLINEGNLFWWNSKPYQESRAKQRIK